MLVEYLWSIPLRYSQYIRKIFPMKFWEIFRNNVLGILNIGIFPGCSMTILQMLHAFFFLVDQQIQWQFSLSDKAVSDTR